MEDLNFRERGRIIFLSGGRGGGKHVRLSGEKCPGGRGYEGVLCPEGG